MTPLLTCLTLGYGCRNLFFRVCHESTFYVLSYFRYGTPFELVSDIGWINVGGVKRKTLRHITVSYRAVIC